MGGRSSDWRPSNNAHERAPPALGLARFAHALVCLTRCRKGTGANSVAPRACGLAYCDRMRPPIDPQAYESLFAGDRAFQRELTETFIAHATSVSEVIEHAYQDRDVQALQRAAHSLKGAA